MRVWAESSGGGFYRPAEPNAPERGMARGMATTKLTITVRDDQVDEIRSLRPLEMFGRWRLRESSNAAAFLSGIGV